MREGDRIVRGDAGMLDSIADLERQIFTDPWSPRSLAGCLTNPAFTFLVTQDGQGEVCGYLIGSLIPPEGEICSLAVRQDRRRDGIGRALVTAFLHRCAELDCECVFLEVRAGNTPALSLYESCGFTEYGRRKNYYRNPTEDAVLMVLKKEIS